MANKDAEKRHAQLREERRALEMELASIDSNIRDAINSGDLPSLERLQTRKMELPKLFIAASTAETTARHEIFNAEDEVNVKALEKAEAQLEKLKAAHAKRQVEVEAEFAGLKTKIEEASAQVSEAYNAITASRELGAFGDAGFRKALANVGV